MQYILHMCRQISFHTQSNQPLLTKYNSPDNNNGKNDKNRSTNSITENARPTALSNMPNGSCNNY